MHIRDEEELFLILNLLEEPDPQYKRQLTEAGYFDENENITPKAEEFVEEFIKSRQDKVFAAVEKNGSYFKDKGYVLLEAGLKKTLAVELILEDLVKQGRLKRKSGHGYIVRCGYNHPPIDNNI
ncbi:MAG: hypothetical protein WAO24_09715 [Peptococcia bacterium]